MFFAIFYRSGEAVVQTNWFIQSILMELALIYCVRTRRPFFKASRPSPLLLTLSLLIGAITIALPFTALGQAWFHFTPTNLGNLAIIGALAMAYFITTDIIKLMYVKLTSNGSLPLQKRDIKERYAKRI